MSAINTLRHRWVWTIRLLLCIASFVGAQSVAAGTESDLAAEVSAIGREYGQSDPRLLPALGQLADHYEKQKDLKSALQVSVRALRINEKALGPQHLGLVPNLVKVARLYYLVGDRRTAMLFFERSFAIQKTDVAPDDPIVLRYLTELAKTYLDLKDYGKALPYLEQTLKFKEHSLGIEHLDLAVTLDDLANLYRELGDYSTALAFAKRGLSIREKHLSPDHKMMAASYATLAPIVSHMGTVSEGMSLLQRARRIATDKLGPMPDRAVASAMQADAMTSDNESYAVAQLQQSMRLIEEKFGPDDSGLALPAINLAYEYAQLERHEKSLPLAYRALRIAVGDPRRDFGVLFIVTWGLADVEQRAGNTELAIFFGKMAINIVQGRRGNLTTLPKELQRTFLEKNASAYRWLFELLVEQGRLPEAQQVLAMLKEEEYFDFIRRDESSDSRTTRASSTSKEQRWNLRLASTGKRLAKLEAERSELTRRSRSGDAVGSAQLAAIGREIQALQIAFHDILRTSQEKAGIGPRGDSSSVVGSGLVEQSAIQQTLQDVGHGSVLLQYVVTDSGIRIILSGPNTLIARESKILKSVLRRKVADFSGWMLTNPGRDPMPLAKELYEVLIAPVADDLRKLNARTIMLSLDDVLRYIPFAALHDGNEFLVERYRLAMYTELAKDKVRLRPASAWQVAGLGLTRKIDRFDPLPSVRQELTGIVRTTDSADKWRGVLPGVIYLDQSFTEGRLRGVLSPVFQVLHIASHFKFYPGAESESFLLLGDGQHLSLADLRQREWDFKSMDLVTLSGCDTGKGGDRDSDGREIEGLGVLVQRQGAKSVIATLWSVSDLSTAILMQTFYRIRQEQNLTKAEALRQAQLAMISGSYSKALVVPKATSDAYAHPYYWAPFILMGNWL